MQQAQDFLKESKLLYDLLKNRDETDLELITQFKNWSINDVIGHLYLFNVAAIRTVDGAKSFADFFTPILQLLNKGQSMVQAQVPWLDGLSGHILLNKWWDSCLELEKIYSEVDPKLRVKWAGPEMSARSSITARQMETWSHGHEVFDRLGKKREEGDHIKNIVHLGVSTLEWTFINRGIKLPQSKPFVLLRLPSKAEISYYEENEKNFIKGTAIQFCQVVTQVRNIADTNLNFSGEAAEIWMKYAQCFAGKPENPPQKGSRFIKIS